MSVTRLLLVRHGETEDNVRQIMQGQTQGKLTPRGVEQAEQLALRLAHEPVGAFVSSDLQRAVDTATILARPHHLSLTTTALLRERDWGDFTGRFIPDLKDAKWPPNVESMQQLMRRASAFLDFIRLRYPGLCVVAVGHGIINKAIQSVYYKRPMNQIEKMANAEVRVLIL